MLCQFCSKNDATVFLKVAVNNKMTELHLCENCVAEKGEALGITAGPMNISGMLGNMSGYFKEFLPKEKRTLHCQACGLAYHQFKESGFLGCPECYKSFEPQLAELLTRIHGNSQHLGKQAAPDKSAQAGKTGGETLAGLKEALKKAIALEDYETAARLRDRINACNKR